MTGRRRAWRRWVGAVVLAATITSCGGGGTATSPSPSGTDAGPENTSPSSAGAETTVAAEGEDLSAIADAARAELDGVDDAAQEARAAAASEAFELAGLAVGGLEAELGGSDAAATAYAALVDPFVAAVAQERAAQPAGFRRQPDQPSAGGLLFGGYMIGAIGAAGIVDSTNGGGSGSFEQTGQSGATIAGSGDVERAGFTATGSTASGDLKGDMRVVAELTVCPAGDGTFELTATIEAGVGSTSSRNGTRFTLDIKVNAQLDDDARLAARELEVRTQAQKYEGSGGVFVDVTTTTDLMPNSTVPSRTVVNRAAESGVAPSNFVDGAVVMGVLLGAVLAEQMTRAVLKGIESGRCVQLDATSDPAERSGVDPLTQFAIRAVPSSRVDGASTGGTVTATLQGASSVDPSGTPVPADADFTYVAPGEPDSTGAVALEARSRRGVGRASLSFDTSGPQAYRIVGGLEDWQVDQVVCDITVPFALTTDIGTMEMSGGPTGSYQASGVFGFSYTGTYAFDFPNGPDQPGTLVGGGGGVIAGQPGSGQEFYTVTPVDC